MEKVEVGEIFTVSDETEEEHEVEVIAKVTLEETEYFAVSFIEDLDEESEEDIDIFFLRIDDEGDIAAIESDEEFDKVSAAFEEMFAEEVE